MQQMPQGPMMTPPNAAPVNYASPTPGGPAGEGPEQRGFRDSDEMPGIRPLPPHPNEGDDKNLSDWRDRTGNTTVTVRRLERLIRDCEQQPTRWRTRADLAHAYYDGKQLTVEQIEACRREQLEPRAINLIARVINTTLGFEKSRRTDPRITADAPEVDDVAQHLNAQLKEAQREAYIDMAISDCYGNQTKGGIGWCEVSRDPDPLNYPYRTLPVHRSEMYWDWHAKDYLLRDARWIIRRQWHDLDELEAAMPEMSDIFRMLANNWNGMLSPGLLAGQIEESPFMRDIGRMSRAFDDFRSFAVNSFDWIDSVRKRVMMYEVWYKVPAIAAAMRLSPTRTALFDPGNMMHRTAVQRGVVKLERVRTRQVRCAIFAGPYRISDIGTAKRNFPYVPFIAFRDDADRSPYGLIEGMIAPQDEYNERRLRMQWLLKARQVTVDNDALDLSKNTFEDLHREVNRPDLTLILNANRKNANGVVVQSSLSLQKEQYEAMSDSRALIQEQPGVSPPQVGEAGHGLTSGVAIANIVEQGIMVMGEMNDRYAMARRMVYEQLMDLIVDDNCTADLKVMIGDTNNRRMVALNTIDEHGLPMNFVKDAPTRVGFAEVPASPAARAQQRSALSEVMKGLGNNPAAVAVLAVPYLQNSDLDSETRQEVIDTFKKLSGLPSGSPAERAAAEKQLMAQQAEKAQRDKDEQDAKTERERSASRLNDAKAAQIRSEAAANGQSVDDALDELDRPPPGPGGAPRVLPPQIASGATPPA